jgi:hypothetical protein
MRKILFVISIIGVVAFAVSCKKEEGVNPLADSNNLGKGAYITLAKTTNLNLNYAAIASSTVSIEVSQYSIGDDVDKIKIYVVQGSNSDPAAWKLIKTVDYTGDNTVLSVTGQQIATALGTTPANLSPGNFYTLYNQIITKGGNTYDISNTYSLVEGNSNYNMAFRWTAYVVCPFVAPVGGTYTVVQDDWVDWSPGDAVTVTDGPAANQVNLSAVWPNPAYGTIINPLYVNVDPATGTATIPTGISWGNYGSYTTSTLAGSTGYVFSCTGRITLSIHVNATGFGDQGFLKLILQK